MKRSLRSTLRGKGVNKKEEDYRKTDLVKS